MKNLIFISGTMGVGKTTTSRHLQVMLPNCVFLDGDWCWDASPFVITEETKHMVINNIAYMLNSFLNCSAYDNIIFCWVMDQPGTNKAILRRINSHQYRLHEFSLICSPETLEKRINIDIINGSRFEGDFQRSADRLDHYHMLDTQKIDVSSITAKQAADLIRKKVIPVYEGRAALSFDKI